MTELVARFALGGALVSTFALLGDLFKPKSLAGAFAAAPSVALATILLTIHRTGTAEAVVAARAMVVGSVALFSYTNAVALMLRRAGGRPRAAAFKCAPVWFIVALTGWAVWLRTA
jgi:Protein of unknown function (DUF3147)